VRGAEDLDVAHEHHEGTGDEQAGDHGPGMLISGLRASPPRVVALSNPTREKTVITTARLRSCRVMPCTFSCAVSVGSRA
jgi:hypothetical protein